VVYHIRILPAAARELARLDKSVGTRIVRRLRWLAENLENIRPEPLSGDLARLFKLRVGDYRVIYEIFSKEMVIIVHSIAHRRDVYRRT
jgi:mRNA interferase RelE/StbE